MKKILAEMLIRDLNRLADELPTEPAAIRDAISRIRAQAEQFEEEDRHNGWTNYETWYYYTVGADGDEKGQARHRMTARDCYEQAEADENVDRITRARWNFAKEMRDAVEEDAPTAEDTTTVYGGLMQAAIEEINFGEIAAAILTEEFAEEIDREEKEQTEARVRELDRGELTELLTAAGIQVYDSESMETLQNAVIANIADGTIEAADLYPDESEAY